MTTHLYGSEENSINSSHRYLHSLPNCLNGPALVLQSVFNLKFKVTLTKSKCELITLLLPNISDMPSNSQKR